MNTKLTLKLNKAVIENAKKYASSHNKSLSRMIESYLKSLIEKDHSNSPEEIEISPFVNSMKSGVSIPADLNLKKEYRDHLTKKHK